MESRVSSNDRQALLDCTIEEKEQVMPSAICTHPWRFDLPPFRIADGVYYVGNRAVCAHLLDTGEGLLLIDTGFPQTVYLLLESIRRLGFDPRDLAIILHTHAHYDHIGGTRALVELTGARTMMGSEDVEIVRERPELTEAELAGTRFYETFTVDEALRDGRIIQLGKFAIRCIHTPGHTPGAMSYFFDATCDDRYCRAGLHGGPGLVSLSDDYLRRHNLPVSLRTDYRTALCRLRDEPVTLHLATHPGQNRLPEKRALLEGNPAAFVNSDDWPAYIDQLTARFEKLFD